jgi:hypothetical protein
LRAGEEVCAPKREPAREPPPTAIAAMSKESPATRMIVLRLI